MSSRTLKFSLMACALFFATCLAPQQAYRVRVPASIDKKNILNADIDRHTFYRMIEAEADARLKSISHLFTAQEMKGLQKIKFKVIHFLKEQNPLIHMKELLIKHGIGVAITSLVGEIVTVAVMPPLLFAIGEPFLAGVIGGVPSPTYLVPAYLAFVGHRQKIKLAKSLALNNMRELDKLRKSLLGFSIDHRLLSTMVAGLEGDEEVIIIKRKFARFRSKPLNRTIDVHELEKIVTRFYDKETLGIIKSATHAEDDLYAAMLLNYIKQDGHAHSHFLELVTERISNSEIKLSGHQQSQLLVVHEKISELDKWKADVRKLKKELIDEVKLQQLSKEQKEIINHFSENLLFDINALQFDMRRFEYSFLNSVHQGQSVAEHFFHDSQNDLINRMRIIRKEIHDHKYETGGTYNTSQNQRFRRFLKSIEDFNIQWGPTHATMSEVSSCQELLTGFLLKAAQ